MDKGVEPCNDVRIPSLIARFALVLHQYSVGNSLIYDEFARMSRYGRLVELAERKPWNGRANRQDR